MSLELVMKVRDAEAQADTLKKDAVAQAKQISLDCQKACSALLEKAQSQAKNQRNETLLVADAAAEQEGEVRRTQIMTQCENITKMASVKMDTAVDIVVERIVKG